ncbi:MAG: DUF1573 domain-containing protein [Bacteroidetes bacterium]|nr:DUF1573 domain-containing protein [Bacteroidota bacterium]
MKYALFGLAAILFVIAGIRFYKRYRQGQGSNDPQTTTIRISRKLIDVGERKQNSVVTASYVIYNTGNDDLYIQNVAPDCHCTVADFSKKAVPPNDSTVITLRYDAVQEGVFQSSAVVSANATDPSTLLIFRGSIVR